MKSLARLQELRTYNLLKLKKIWYKATLKMDEELYMLMKKMIIEEDIAILLNRNPTISFGSILYLRVAGIKHDYDIWEL